MRKNTVTFPVTNLSPEGIEKLKRGWCQVYNLSAFWLTKEQWMDTTHDSLYHSDGVLVADGADYEALFEDFVKSLGMPEYELHTALRLWESNPQNEVIWE